MQIIYDANEVNQNLLMCDGCDMVCKKYIILSDWNLDERRRNIP